ncbi:MAG: DNA-binding transcriptional regulator [Ignavibacteria bacterium]|jgi:LacI family transcriptional regulator
MKKNVSGKRKKETERQLSKVILLVETSRTFGRDLLCGIARYSKLHGPWVFYREPRSLKSRIPHLTSWKANGIIMRDSVISNELLKLGIPTILVVHDPKRPGRIPSVITEGYRISQLAAEHLLNRGLHHFAYCGFDEFYWSNERKIFFQEIIKQAGYETKIYGEGFKRKYKSWEKEQLQMAEWLKTLPKPVGIMTCNDDRGNHVLEACKIAKLHVPEDVSVIGVDNDALVCDLCDPPLTSIALNTEAAGYSTAELLDRLMNGEKMQSQEIKVAATHVVRRQSTDIMAIEDSDVVSAIRFIRQNAKSKIKVDDVVENTCLSRRSLESRFRKILDRSIQDEIRKIRIELISQMLIETNLSIAEITSMFSFTGIEHISRYFKKEKGISLREFRKINRNC